MGHVERASYSISYTDLHNVVVESNVISQLKLKHSE